MRSSQVLPNTIIVSMLLGIAVLVHAHSKGTNVVPDASALAQSDVIVEGKVSEVLLVSMAPEERPCFASLYLLHVDRVLKGSVAVGERLAIGHVPHYGSVRVGDRQLIAARRSDPPEVAQCRTPMEAIHMARGTTIFRALDQRTAVFRIALDSQGTERFESVNCLSAQILYSDYYLSRRTRGVDGATVGQPCLVLEGEYSSLIQRLSADLGEQRAP
jgi:hypothetical protein